MPAIPATSAAVLESEACVGSGADLTEERRLVAEAANAVQDFLLGLATDRMFRGDPYNIMAFSNALEELRTTTLRAMLAAGDLALDGHEELLGVWTKVIGNELAKAGDASSRVDLLLFLRSSNSTVSAATPRQS